MSYARVSIITNLQLRTSKYIRGNDKQNMTNTMIYLVAHKLHQIHMNNQEKFTTQSSKLKEHSANSQTILSYPVRFSTDILFSSLVSFAFVLSSRAFVIH